ncbi:MAG TPA: aminoacyl-tRNA deacylase [Anaerolineaceae bacterium]|nr:aminoacyl-tRNA deacylase [Anaerolineaceae bacterium]HQN04864.1 aminoacyl-tRNA deacylase [Anaerolineaceae bacterium]HQP08597.1 aminoacyl-tRNA deacylase [Anaerolineaceae bacterium]
MKTNNITRMLDARKIAYQVFELPEEKVGAVETALILGVPAAEVFKTIVVQREKPGKAILAVVPGDSKVDLKKLAAAAGEKKLRLTTQAEAEKLTGLLVGGISPLALLNKGFQIILDESALKYEQIHISGGQRGMNIRLAVKDLIAITGALVAPVSE